ncbi:MAG: transposase [Bdellovibrionales bacterium]
MKQLSLIPNASHSFIGKVFCPTKGQRKARRPLSTQHPIHLILRTKRFDLRRQKRSVCTEWHRFAKRFGMKTHRLVVAGDHIHAIVQLHSLKSFAPFVQAVTGTLARRFNFKWLCRPTTRIASWGRDFKRLCQYVKLNWLEANGLIEYQPKRTRALPDWVKL